ncbi:5'-Nucleotidase domain protein [Psychromonas ingrahamii 37]|uniref:5'-Nucleotidase domain protein n=1 Tax=Psychromonas ingrahamii (strain DSM 17664 / CCUG 51855 / 37) TaxID=357804 RepID=A1SY40_PSYIN|nr:bifunctional UDP-sugar hydrolase/5'-nucleotidase UshA [Psychromonas ingrahamii]ABM04405.1 5'-Nucleotidase domain protein [Psychromonas ingrahamii 37]
MKKILMKGLVATAVITALTACNDNNSDPQLVSDPKLVVPQTCVEAAEDCTTFTLLHTNDNHGRFWENKYGEYGMAARKTLIDNIRAEVEADGGESILLSGGDINTGVPESDLQDAIPDFIGMNLIEYDAMAVGNHEFDNPLSVVEMQRNLANFPMLAANIYDKATGKRYFDAYKIFTVNGLRIAVIGLTTEDTVKIGNPEFISSLEFRNPQEEIQKVIKEIKAANSADLIFATTHMGHYADGQNGSNAPGDVALARAVSEGDLLAIIGGHSQNPVCMEPGENSYAAEFKAGADCAPDQQNGTYILQAHEWGKYVGRADFEYFNGKLQLASYKLIPVNLKEKNTEGERVLIEDAIKADINTYEVLKYYQDKGQESLGEVIASTAVKLDGDRSIVRFKQTNLGHLLAEAQRDKVAADIGIMNSGGVRADIEFGDITYKDVLTVQPFANTVTKSTMTGAQISTYLGEVASLQIDSGAYAQLTGVQMTVNCTAKTVAITDINGKGYDAAGSYSFTVPSFNAAGGDGYPILTPVMTGYVDAEVLYSYLKARVSIAAGDFAPSASDVIYENSLSSDGCQIAAG